jgi:hypothetical protein
MIVVDYDLLGLTPASTTLMNEAIFSLNIGNCLQDYTALQPKIPQSTFLPP